MRSALLKNLLRSQMPESIHENAEPDRGQQNVEQKNEEEGCSCSLPSIFGEHPRIHPMKNFVRPSWYHGIESTTVHKGSKGFEPNHYVQDQDRDIPPVEFHKTLSPGTRGEPRLTTFLVILILL
ncbi:MAG: hypothetical protein JWL80_444 [Parcubacteria group bacterium]|nr:hypothetical protein [Parcubacteria group bacterium]